MADSYLTIFAFDFSLLLINHFINLDKLLNFRQSYLSFLWRFLMKKLSWLEREPWSIYIFLYLSEIINKISNQAPPSADPQIKWTRKFVPFFKSVIPGQCLMGFYQPELFGVREETPFYPYSFFSLIETYKLLQ